MSTEFKWTAPDCKCGHGCWTLAWKQGRGIVATCECGHECEVECRSDAPAPTDRTALCGMLAKCEQVGQIHEDGESLTIEPVKGGLVRFEFDPRGALHSMAWGEVVVTGPGAPTHREILYSMLARAPGIRSVDIEGQPEGGVRFWIHGGEGVAIYFDEAGRLLDVTSGP